MCSSDLERKQESRQHKSTASIYAVLVVKTRRARVREGESERAREGESERKRESASESERERVRKRERANL